jgi:hypothetical protein
MFRYEIFDGELKVSGRPGFHEQWSSYLSGNSPGEFPSAVLGLRPKPQEFFPHLSLRRSIASLVLAGPSSLHGKIYLKRMTASVDDNLTPTAGSSKRIWGSTVAVVSTRVSGSDDSDSVHNQPWTVVSLINVVGPSYAGWSNGGSAVPALGAFVFWNRSLNEAAYALNSILAIVSVQGVHLERQSLTAVIPFGKNADSREKAEKWVAGSELVWVVFTPKEYYWTPLEVSKFTLSKTIE